jgi:enoyl-CoA hydratase
MEDFKGETLSWQLREEVIELALHRPPANEMGMAMLVELERFVTEVETVGESVSVLIIHSSLKSGFSAGGDLHELYAYALKAGATDRGSGIRPFLELSHRLFAAIDSFPLVTIAAVHGVCFGSGFELALVCDLIVADKTTRFCFPELRLGFIPVGGGIPRLKRDLGNGVVRDLLLTGRSISADKAMAVGLLSQVVAEGQALTVARSTAAQIKRIDPTARVAAKRFIKPIPDEGLHREIDIFCRLFSRPAVVAGLRKFVENRTVMPHLP